MKFELNYIGPDEAVVSYEDGSMDILKGNKLKEFLSNNNNVIQKVEIDSSGSLFGESLIAMLDDFVKAKENGESQIGERAVVTIVNEDVKVTSKGVTYYGKYEVIGENSGESYGIQEVYLEDLNPPWYNINVIYRSLLQLWFSGVYATEEDEYNFKVAMGNRKNPNVG